MSKPVEDRVGVWGVSRGGGNPVLVIERLGPLENTSVELQPLTLLTGPPARGKTLILNAVFDELMPADRGSVEECLFQGRGSSLREIAESLYKEKIIDIILDNIRLAGGDRVSIGRIGVCVDTRRGAERLSNCMRDYLYPGDSRFSLRLPGLEKRLVEYIVETLTASLYRHGFSESGDGRLCLVVENADAEIRLELKITGTSDVTDKLMLFKKILSMTSSPEPVQREYIKWILFMVLLSGEVSGKLSQLKDALKAVKNDVESVYSEYRRYRPVYSWMGRGLVSFLVLEAWSEDEPLMTFSATSMGRAGIPVLNLAQAIREGLKLYSSPSAPKELPLLLDIAKPAIVYQLLKGEDNRLYLKVGERAIPFRFAHGSALSVVSLILASLPLLREGRGYLLVDEAEHLLHPSVQTIVGFLLLALAGAGLHVIVSTHSSALAAAVAKLGENSDNIECLVRKYYDMLGFEPPSREAIQLIERGVKRGARIYVVDSSVRPVNNPLTWIDKLSDAWYTIASWASMSVDECIASTRDSEPGEARSE